MHKAAAVKEKLLENAKQGSPLWGTLEGSRPSHRPRNPQPPEQMVPKTCAAGDVRAAEAALAACARPAVTLPPRDVWKRERALLLPSRNKTSSDRPMPAFSLSREPGDGGIDLRRGNYSPSPAQRKSRQCFGADACWCKLMVLLGPLSSPASPTDGGLMAAVPYPLPPPAFGRAQKIPLSPSCSY